METPNELELLKEEEAAELTRHQPATYRDWRVRGKGPPYIILPSGAIRYEKNALMEWVLSGRGGDNGGDTDNRRKEG